MRLTVVMLHELSYAVSVCLKSRHMTQDGMGREEGGGFRIDFLLKIRKKKKKIFPNETPDLLSVFHTVS